MSQSSNSRTLGEQEPIPGPLPVLGYLTSQYPKTSHTFIVREIQTLEALGQRVDRYALRRPGPEDGTADPEELAKTRFVLDVGPMGLASAMLRELSRAPIRFLRVLLMAVRLGRRTERGLAANLVYFAEACVLRGWLEGLSHLHVHFGANAASAALLCRDLGGPPFSVTFHGPGEFDSPSSLRLREKVAAAEFVVAISSYARSQIFRWADPRDWSKVHVIRCGLDQSYRDAASPVPDVPVLVNVGRLSEQKGQLLLVHAAAAVRDGGVPVELLLVGDGEMRPDIEAAIAEHCLEDKVRLAGWLSNEQTREAVRQSRGLVLASFAEGLPVVLMEAMAMGRPVVSTAVNGIPELVDEQVGWLVPAGSVEALAAAMCELLAAPTERLTRMGQTGAARVARRHDVAVEARRLLDLITGPQRVPLAVAD
jgi:colanic acid/amylovoran biosynthesis glycosyltransferase